jgi:hypothetical protein
MVATVIVLLAAPPRSKFIQVSRTRNIGPKVAIVCAALGLGACGGTIVTPEEDGSGIGGRGGSGGRASRGGSAGRGGEGPRTPVVEDAGVVASGGSSGAGGEGDDTPDTGGSLVAEPRVYCDAYTQVFRPSCGPSCHQNVGVPIGDFGYEPDSALAYVNRVSVRNAECGLIINPNEPLESLILTKVNGEYPLGMNCGQPMPVGSIEITNAQINCLEDWVLQFQR